MFVKIWIHPSSHSECEVDLAGGSYFSLVIDRDSLCFRIRRATIGGTSHGRGCPNETTEGAD